MCVKGGRAIFFHSIFLTIFVWGFDAALPGGVRSGQARSRLIGLAAKTKTKQNNVGSLRHPIRQRPPGPRSWSTVFTLTASLNGQSFGISRWSAGRRTAWGLHGGRISLARHWDRRRTTKSGRLFGRAHWPFRSQHFRASFRTDQSCQSTSFILWKFIYWIEECYRRCQDYSGHHFTCHG